MRSSKLQQPHHWWTASARFALARRVLRCCTHLAVLTPALLTARHGGQSTRAGSAATHKHTKIHDTIEVNFCPSRARDTWLLDVARDTSHEFEQLV